MMLRKCLILSLLILLSANFVLAHSESDHNDFSDVINIIEAETSCDELTEAQKERIGDYYMERMHPGEAHIQMDSIMGGEGSESLEQAHINMAERLYCVNVNGSTEFLQAIGLGLIVLGSLEFLSYSLVSNKK